MSPLERIAVRDLRNDVSSIIRRVESGESFHVTRHGQLVARLIPATDQRTPVSFADLMRLRQRVPIDPDYAGEVRRRRDLDRARDPFANA